MTALPPWHPHWDVWMVVSAFLLGYLYLEQRFGARQPQRWCYFAGVASILAVADWPVHDLAEQALFSVHMVQHMVLTLVAPPLLLVGLPRQVADTTLGHRWVLPWLRQVAKPVPAFAVFNATMIITHWPEVVDRSLRSEPFHFTVHAWLFLTAIFLWLPVFSPTPSIPRISSPARMLYLFLQTILPTVPASFLTFSHSPIYRGYGDAALAYGLTAVEDQTIAGLIMKLGGGFLLIGVIAAIWFRWSADEARWERLEKELSSGR